MPVVGAVMVPHPPLILPEVGRGGEREIEQTTAAYRKAAAWLSGLRPDTLVVVTPHSVMYADYLHLSPGDGAKGNFGRFGAPAVRFEVAYDAELRDEILAFAHDRGLPAGTRGERDAALDHGFMVPLYFLRQAAGVPWPFRFLRVGLSGLSFQDHYRLGQCIGDAAVSLDRRVAVVASGDLSHYLRADGPYGFRAEGPEYDRKVMDIVGRAAFSELLDLPEGLCAQAGECGQRSLLIMVGALDGRVVAAEALSYQGVTGVGYGVATFLPGEMDLGRAYLRKGEGK